MRIRWTRQALNNLDAAVSYIAEDKPEAARKFAQKDWDNSSFCCNSRAWADQGG